MQANSRPVVPESLPHTEPHWDAASCRQMDVQIAREYFFADSHQPAKIAMAKRICANCVDLQKCRDYGLENAEPFGVFGGLDARDRYRILMSGDVS
jgi:hypothetical protein